ncbi:transporter, hydrophobe/amphiphile efflux-1 (HAE1) family [Citrobacter freundii]|uniref:Transporter, hydrophobe/amphiphile efflux-1 (HAE1) family n=1 Tax=Citrobacter freundii TaxID=546 RepID=A0A7G2IQH9_CITFR|nr:transporter, hydrophobe/amphiphile efflux-1 (HAE1) family [Citrobacter freundii]
MFVSASLKSVAMTLLEATVLVVLVVMLFLQTWRASIIPLVAVPISLVGTFALMYLFGFSLNTLSLFGLVLSIGIVVDDAIVVVEKRRTAYCTGPFSERSGKKGHGRGDWPYFSHYFRFGCCVYSFCVPVRIAGGVLSPVRADHRHFDDLVCDQLVDVVAGAGIGSA